MKQYLNLIEDVLENGRLHSNRTGINTYSVFGRQARFNLSEGFPLLTTKKVFLRGIIEELLWFLRGETNIKPLVDKNVHIWDAWAYKNYKTNSDNENPMSMEDFILRIKESKEFANKWGELGTGTYGSMWRDFPCSEEYTYGVDQIKKVYDQLVNNPEDRRIIVNAWHPYWVDHCALPPCHVLFHFKAEKLTDKERAAFFIKNKLEKENIEEVPKYKLNLLLYQRSCDLFLGVPFNIASYSILLLIFSKLCNMIPGDFIHTYGDLHIYENHLDQVKEQLKREPRELPNLNVKKNLKTLEDVLELQSTDFEIQNYNPHPTIKGSVAV